MHRKNVVAEKMTWTDEGRLEDSTYVTGETRA